MRRRLLGGVLGGAVAAAVPPRLLAHGGAAVGYAPRQWVPYAYRLPPDGDVVGRAHYVSARAEETLLDIAREFDVGYWDIALANPEVDLWLPGEGARVLIPAQYVLPDAPREGIVVNLPEMRLYYYPPPVPGEPRYVITHPVGIGRQGWTTPLGVATITELIPDPAWYPPASIRAEHAARGEVLPGVVPPGPENPLGRYAIILDLPGYLIHGTNRPAGVGMQVSHGCVRLYPEDIERLFGLVRRGMPVRLVYQSLKLGRLGESLYAQLRPLPSPNDYRRLDRQRYLGELSRFRHAVRRAAAASAARPVDPQPLAEAALQRGLPVHVPLV